MTNGGGVPPVGPGAPLPKGAAPVTIAGKKMYITAEAGLTAFSISPSGLIPSEKRSNISSEKPHWYSKNTLRDYAGTNLRGAAEKAGLSVYGSDREASAAALLAIGGQSGGPVGTYQVNVIVKGGKVIGGYVTTTKAAKEPNQKQAQALFESAVRGLEKELSKKYSGIIEVHTPAKA